MITSPPETVRSRRGTTWRVTLALLLAVPAFGQADNIPVGTQADTLANTLVNAAIARTDVNVRYDGAYVALAYPGGDVPDNTGVCTDLVIRAYRAIGIDLQEAVHEDMRQAFEAYPSRSEWGLEQPDPNIDHRRVPNLQAFLVRAGAALPISAQAADYRPGDLVTWLLNGRQPHIGIVTDRYHPVSGEPLIVHNSGAGPRLDDMLFSQPITGHFRYLPGESRASVNP